MNHECFSQNVGAGKITAGTNARFPEHRLAKTLLIDKETVHRSVDSVGNQKKKWSDRGDLQCISEMNREKLAEKKGGKRARFREHRLGNS